MTEVIKCANPFCGKHISIKKRRETLGGRQVYCSWECYKAFTPKMLQVSRIWLEGENETPLEALRRAISYVNKFLRYKRDRAGALKISGKTFEKWKILLKI